MATIQTYDDHSKRPRRRLLVWARPGAYVDFTVQINGKNYNVEVGWDDVARMTDYLAKNRRES